MRPSGPALKHAVGCRASRIGGDESSEGEVMTVRTRVEYDGPYRRSSISGAVQTPGSGLGRCSCH